MRRNRRMPAMRATPRSALDLERRTGLIGAPVLGPSVLFVNRSFGKYGGNMITSRNSLTSVTQWALAVTLAFAGAACGSSGGSSPTDAGKGGAGGSATGTGGKGGSGGTSTGTGGSNVDAGTVPGALATFDSTLDGFALAVYTPSAPYKNLGDPNLGFTPAPTMTLDTTEGSPTAGSLKVTAGFNDFNQFVEVQKVVPTTTLMDWSGKTTLNVRVKVDSGFSADPNNPGGAQVYAQSFGAATTDGGTATYSYVSNYNNVASTAAGMGYLVYSLTLPAAGVVNGSPWDPSKVFAFGLQLSTGGGGGAPDGGASVKPTPAVFHIDSFSLQ
jgi:hypothetical protein